MHHNNFLKIVFVLVAIFFLFVMVNTVQTDCEACEIEFNGEIIDGLEAVEEYRSTCLHYYSPTDPLYANIDDINISYIDGVEVWDIDEDDIVTEVNYD